ncbi:hypothetical protein C8Q70DRAFT_559133 [Cubamyces menziesii]|nr:hypothetical protein C8Q70DRAFT_559133 [Cubamyces menziesii]
MDFILPVRRTPVAWVPFSHLRPGCSAKPCRIRRRAVYTIRECACARWGRGLPLDTRRTEARRRPRQEWHIAGSCHGRGLNCDLHDGSTVVSRWSSARRRNGGCVLCAIPLPFDWMLSKIGVLSSLRVASVPSLGVSADIVRTMACFCRIARMSRRGRSACRQSPLVFQRVAQSVNDYTAPPRSADADVPLQVVRHFVRVAGGTRTAARRTTPSRHTSSNAVCRTARDGYCRQGPAGCCRHQRRHHRR